ncbi:MAG: sialidase family protein [Rhodothermales bacterium]|nr:sialidase family protein [Rhodothermales bacterium]MDG2016248.1 sialidase family protein [Rhodothermales bacterium]
MRILFAVLVFTVASFWSSFGGTVEVDLIPLQTQGIAGEPHLSGDPDGRVFMSWVERSKTDSETEAALRWSELVDGTWTPAQTIAKGADWFVNWADVPSVTAAGSGHMMAHWLQRLGENRYAYGVRYAVSNDEGASWSAPAWLHQDLSPTEHGFVSVVPVPTGYIATWLDGNGYASGTNEMAMHARSIAWDGSLGEESAVDTRTCDCCPTTMTSLEDGTVMAFYRDRSEGEVRDIYTSRFENKTWSEPVPVHNDGWMLQACPVNGPAAHSSDETVAVAWFTAAGGSPAVHVAFSGDQGLTFEAPIQIDSGRPTGRVALRMVSDSEVAVMWIESAGSEEAGLMLKIINRAGKTLHTVKVADTSSARSSGYPRLEKFGDSLIAAWTVPGEPSTLQTAQVSW